MIDFIYERLLNKIKDAKKELNYERTVSLQNLDLFDIEILEILLLDSLERIKTQSTEDTKNN